MTRFRNLSDRDAVIDEHFCATSTMPRLDDETLAYERARTLLDSGRYYEALLLFSRLSAGGYRHAELARHLGWCRLATENFAGAESCMREAVVSDSADWRSHYGLGEALRARDPVSAKAAFAEALARSPKNLHCLLNLCVCALASNDTSAAESYARLALDVAPNNAAAWTNLGFALLAQDRLQQAGDAFGKGERLASASSDDDEDTEDLNRGVALRLLGKTAEAIEYYQTALPEHPSVGAHAQYALALLTAGQFRAGWDQYEFRWLEPPLSLQHARYGRPAWAGQDLADKTILIRCEQGAGDVFQFIRYAPLLKARGATVFLELRPGLGLLGAMFRGIDRTFRNGEVTDDFDFYIDLMSLPRVFDTTLDTIPSGVPYIDVAVDSQMKWRSRLTGGPDLKVGLVWAGDPAHRRDRQRSMRLEAFAGLVETEGTHWFSLQTGPATRALRDPRFDRRITDLDPHLLEYADTAAAIQYMDVVVTVDTSVAHLAGALGKPVWVLLPFVADWRWLEDRDDSPWYPTMRLFRQDTPNDWQTVVQRVQMELLHTVRSRNREGSTVPTRVRPSPKPGESRNIPSGGDGISRACRTRVGMIQYIPDSTALARSIEYYGEHLQLQMDILRMLIAPSAVVAEIDAGIGLHTIALANAVGPDGHVFAIERSRIIRRILRQNLIVNDIKNVTIMPPAINDHSLDQIDFERLDVLKLNKEAAVARYLDTATNTLWRLRPMLLLCCESKQSATTYVARVLDFGYRCWCIATRLYNPTNFNRRSDDLFYGDNSFALLALPEESNRAEEISAMPEIESLHG
jgi:tetratricopeptide (TPR) repeat protein